MEDALLERLPSLSHALQPDNDEPVAVADLELALKHLAEINAESPATNSAQNEDRDDTQEALEGLLKTMKRRDRAMAVLGGESTGTAIYAAKFEKLRPISPLRVPDGWAEPI